MRGLTGRIPRALRNDKTPEGYAYGKYLRGILARLGPLPPDARPLLREVGLVVVDLMRTRQELETARARNRRKDIRRYNRELAQLRYTLMHLERRLEARVGRNEDGTIPDFATLLAAQAAQRDGDED